MWFSHSSPINVYHVVLTLLTIVLQKKHKSVNVEKGQKLLRTVPGDWSSVLILGGCLTL